MGGTFHRPVTSVGAIVALIRLMALITTPSARIVIGCAIKVHRVLGSGIFESVYGPCLAHEMTKAGLRFTREMAFPLTYDGLSFARAFRVDFVVENELVLEVKAVTTLAPVHDSQVLTYMRLLGLRKGLLINFNVPVLKNGIRSFVL
jgi:GxxExxY protein